jgi:hypothetical protein
MKILSSDGFKGFEGFINQGSSTTLLRIYLSNNFHIDVTHSHTFLMQSGEWLEAELLCDGDIFSTELSVVRIENVDNQIVYDAYGVEDTHDYYTNGVISHNCNLLYVDEAAIIPNTIAEQFFTSVYPTISAGETTKILLSSTPLGYNHFWKYWNDALNGRNGFVNLFIPYWEIPGRDKKWAEEQRKILGDLKFNQEVLCLRGDMKIKIRDRYTLEEMELPISLVYEILESRQKLFK